MSVRLSRCTLPEHNKSAEQDRFRGARRREERDTMAPSKLVACVLSSLLLLAGCTNGTGTTIVNPGQPPAQLSIAPLQAIDCLGNAASNFGDIGTSGNDDHVAIKVAWATLQTIFTPSCQVTASTTLSLLKQQLDSTTYLYVGQGQQYVDDGSQSSSSLVP